MCVFKLIIISYVYSLNALFNLCPPPYTFIVRKYSLRQLVHLYLYVCVCMCFWLRNEQVCLTFLGRKTECVISASIIYGLGLSLLTYSIN